ncbi:MAG: hypothetical protein Q9220_006130 [cf. Caloplaca sp. 1 TL-2023]
MDRSFLVSTKGALDFFHVSEDQGLSYDQVVRSREKHGPNALPEDPSTPLWKLVLEQFKDQLVVILLGSAAISFVLALFEDSEGWTAFVDPLVILTILVLNAIVGVSQESSAEKAIAALQEYSANEAKVVRNGALTSIKAEELVPGDIISIAVGDRVPADCRLLSVQSNNFRLDQAILTGESESVGKDTKAIDDAGAVKQDQINILFSGTTVVTGHAVALVVLTGGSTAIGDIHESITSQISEPTPLKEKLNDFGDMLAKVITVICILVWLINIQHFSDPSHGSWTKGAIYYLKIAVSLGVAAIPEGLAVVITTCLALGTRKMAAKNAVVRSLPSVETLGSCSVICSDKTGTLTTNQMSVNKVVFFNHSGTGLEEIDVEGTTFSPEGALSSNGNKVDHLAASSETALRMTEVAALCNESQLSFDAKNGTVSNVGEPTEGALRVLVEKICTPEVTLNQKIRNLPLGKRLHSASKYYQDLSPLVSTYEFSRDRKSMSVLVGPESQQRLLVKGAPESVIERCTHTLIGSKAQRIPLEPKQAEMLSQEVVEYGNRGLRVIAVAYKENLGSKSLLSKAKTTEEYLQIEQDLTFIGLVGMLDPPRPEVAASIRKCKEAGIRVVVITGDNRNTAESICRQIGIFRVDEDVTGKSYTGREFDALSNTEKAEVAMRASLFSRTEPSHKSQLVDLLQSQGQVVAMTGDGVNDAPALKKSDIGVAMGSGTDVSKLAADMVLADDNFATIEVAVEEGRSIYNNTQQFIRYLISSNIGEVVSIFLTAAIGMPEALIPVQLLWVNLVTDGLPATALSFNPPDHDVMRRPPRKRDEALVGGWLFFRYMVVGIYVGAATVFGYAWWFMFNSEGPQVTFWQLCHFHRCSSQFPEIGCEMFSNDSAKAASTMSLSILVVIEMLNAMNALSSSESLLTLPLWENMMLVYAISLSMALHFALLYTPFLQGLFSIVALNWNEWKAVLWISIPVIFIDEILKFFERKIYLPEPLELQLPRLEVIARSEVITMSSFANATAVKAVDSHTYTANFSEDWCIGNVPHGGLVTSCFLSATALHFSTTHAALNQPQTITLHLTFVRRTSVGPALFTFRDVKLGRRTSTIHVALSQSSNDDSKAAAEPSVIGYITQSNLRTEEGISLPTKWKLDPPPLPLANLDFLRQGREGNWHSFPHPHAKFRKAGQKVQSYVPRKGQLEPGMADEWIRLKDGGRFTQEALGYVVDQFPQIVEIYPGTITGEGKEDCEWEGQKHEVPGKPNWYPTVLLNMDVKKALPEGGAEWLFVRVRAKKIQNGRMDLEVVVLDEGGDLMVVSNHVCLILSAERNVKRSEKGKGDGEGGSKL